MRLRLIQVLTAVAALFSVYLYTQRPDIEQYSKLYFPGNPKPDAFNGLNKAIPLLMVMITVSLLLAARINGRRQFVLYLPLSFGPSACLVGWYVTEDLSDPNWFDLTALATIGMLVSCAITTLLSFAIKQSARQAIGGDSVDRPD